MPIPESQLETWSHQGAKVQSSLTYNTIKSTLESSDSTYSGRDFSIFLQGSYGNDTNIFKESDVDIVIRLNSCFYYDIDRLSAEQKAIFNTIHASSSQYDYFNFKRDVLSFLKSKYGGLAVPGNKAIKIKAGGNRREADILVTGEYRNYTKYLNQYDQDYMQGVCFFHADTMRVSNYPKQHSDNCTSKHQATNGYFKPMVRIVKNMRNKLIDDKKIEANLAPSCYIENLLYNVPNEKYGIDYQNSFANGIRWLSEQQDKSKFVCANRQRYLLGNDPYVAWQPANCTDFINALCALWNNW
jgi:hypothetical protein